MARDGEPLHADASESVREGYRRGKLGFGTNVMPKNFGKDGVAPEDWTCICGYVNSGRMRKRVGGRTVCWQCEIEKDVALTAIKSECPCGGACVCSGRKRQGSSRRRAKSQSLSKPTTSE